LTADRLIALILFVAAGSGSPGPNNTLLLSSGITFGFRATVPHVVGTSVGMLLLVGLAAGGESAVVTTVPAVQVALKVIATAYLAYLAARMARGLTLSSGTIPEPFTATRAIAFQFVNPKGWIFALALAAGFIPERAAGVTGPLALAVTVALVVGVTAGMWALFGHALTGLLAGEARRRAAGLILGAMLLASVAFIWM